MVKVVFKNNENKEIDLTKETEKVVRKTIKLVGLILKKAGDKLEDITKGEQQLSLIFLLILDEQYKTIMLCITQEKTYYFQLFFMQ